MDYTTNNTKCTKAKCPLKVGATGTSQDFGGHEAIGALTNYKEVVDITENHSFYDKRKIVHYGLSQHDLEVVKFKLKNQKQFLDNTLLYDKINKTHIPLSEIVISAYHSPKRYYSEIQNRVNTLEKIAKERGLQPIFLTLTLPSEYHKYKENKHGVLVENKKYNGTTPKDAIKVLTKMFARLRQDRALKDLRKEERIYFRVNEPHKDGTPHTHILLFVPSQRVEKVKRAYARLYDIKANDIQIINNAIDNSVAYVMKYINKTLPLSKKDTLSEKEEYLNAWYSKNRIVRFNASKTLAPLNIYRLIYSRYSMYALTRLIKEGFFKIYVTIDTNKVMQIIDEYGEDVYIRSENYSICPIGDNSLNYQPTNESALGVG